MAVNRISSSYVGDIGRFDLGFSASRQTQGAFATQAESDIIVIGNPSSGYTFDYINTLFLPGISYPAYSLGFLYGYQPNGPFIEREIYFGVARLQARRQAIVEALDAQSGDNDFGIMGRDATGKSVYVNTSLSEFRTFFRSFQFNVVQGLKLEAGYGGFTLCKDGNCFSNIQDQMFLNYYKKWGDAGMDYYMLHEVAHNFVDMKRYENEVAATYLNSSRPNYDSGYASSDQFRSIERMTNTLARELARIVGTVLPADVPHGYF